MAKTPTRPDLADRITLRPRDAARALGISERTLRDLLGSGAIAHMRLKRAILIPRADLEAFVAARLERGGRA